MRTFALIAAVMTAALLASVAEAQTRPSLQGAAPFVVFPGAAAAPDPGRVYKVVFDVRHASLIGSDTVDGVRAAATLVSNLRGQGVPADHIKVVLVFRDDAVETMLNDAAYRSRFHQPNPNAAMLRALKESGAQLLVGGQDLVINRMSPQSLAGEVTVASDAFIALVAYQNDGYALLSF